MKISLDIPDDQIENVIKAIKHHQEFYPDAKLEGVLWQLLGAYMVGGDEGHAPPLCSN
jgi:hypothetical protein